MFDSISNFFEAWEVDDAELRMKKSKCLAIPPSQILGSMVAVYRPLRHLG